MRLATGCEITFAGEQPTPLILMLRPRSGLGQWVVQEAYQMEPAVPVVEYTDSYGNLCQRLVSPPGQFRVRITATVETANVIDVEQAAPFVPVQLLPDYTLQFLLPSRYCQSDQLGELAGKITTAWMSGYEQVESIRRWIHTQVDYQYGTSDASTSALDTATKRVGVCRDFAHLGIALCRSLNIPARMVVGYLHELEPMDLHAWFEAFLGVPGSATEGRWYTFDATQEEPRGNRVAIAYGRDAADVALATQFGPLALTQMKVWVNALEEAISTPR